MKKKNKKQKQKRKLKQTQTNSFRGVDFSKKKQKEAERRRRRRKRKKKKSVTKLQSLFERERESGLQQKAGRLPRLLLRKKKREEDKKKAAELGRKNSKFETRARVCRRVCRRPCLPYRSSIPGSTVKNLLLSVHRLLKHRHTAPRSSREGGPRAPSLAGGR